MQNTSNTWIGNLIQRLTGPTGDWEKSARNLYLKVVGLAALIIAVNTGLVAASQPALPAVIITWCIRIGIVGTAMTAQAQTNLKPTNTNPATNDTGTTSTTQA